MAINRLNPDYPDAGLVQLVPTSITVGSGSGAVNGNGQVTFSGASSIQLNGVFSATYDNYRIQILVESTTASINNIYMRFGTNGTPNTNTPYNTRGYYMDSSGNPLGFVISNTSYLGIASDPNLNTGGYSYSGDILNPYIAYETIASGRSGSLVNLRDTNTIGFFDGLTSFTDVIVFPSSGNFAGRISIYGYRN